MLNLGGLDDLANALGVELSYLHAVLEDFDLAPASLVKDLTLWQADQSKKPRDVICIRKRWRLIQERIYTKLLLPWFDPLKCCHGGVRRRSSATNARIHLGNRFAFVADISNFFPSIYCHRVNSLFLGKACSYEVASALTRLCTYDYHLALGLVTSPIIANDILRPIDEEIERFCRRNGFAYSRFIDDITISSKFDLKRWNVEKSIEQTMTRHNFKLAAGKSAYGRLDVVPAHKRLTKADEQISITGIRLKGNHLDPSRKFITELERIIADHKSLADNGVFTGPLYLQSEVYGKAHYACSLNSGRRRLILGKMREIDWWKALSVAMDRKLVRFNNQMTERGAPRPDCATQLPMSAGAEFVKKYYETHSYDPSEAPFDSTGELADGANR